MDILDRFIFKEVDTVKKLHEKDMPSDAMQSNPKVLCIDQGMKSPCGRVAVLWTHYIKDDAGVVQAAFLEIIDGKASPVYILGLAAAKEFVQRASILRGIEYLRRS